MGDEVQVPKASAVAGAESESSESAAPEPSLRDVLARLDQFAEVLGGVEAWKKTVNGDLAKLRRRTSAASGEPSADDRVAPSGSAPVASGLSPASSFRLARALDGLPDDLVEDVLSQVDQGGSLDLAFARAEAFRAGLAAATAASTTPQSRSGATPRLQPRDDPRSPPNPRPALVPKSKREFAALLRKEPDRYRALLHDQAFDLAALPD